MVAPVRLAGVGAGSGPTVRLTMTTPDTTFARTPQVRETLVFPDPPYDPDDKMTSFDHLTITGTAHYLAIHLGNPETTLVAGDRYLAVAPTRNLSGVRYPDMLVAFGVDPEAYRRSNAYVISEQGKPPDLVLEVASRSTGHVDVTEKRVDYAALGVPEYWRFDETGAYHGARLGGDRLVDGEYVPVEIEELSDNSFQGYSAVLNLNLRWADGELAFYDPATGEPIATLETERRARFAAEAHAETERVRADTQQTRADVERDGRLQERQAREAAEARVRELEERLRSRGG